MIINYTKSFMKTHCVLLDQSLYCDTLVDLHIVFEWFLTAVILLYLHQTTSFGT